MQPHWGVAAMDAAAGAWVYTGCLALAVGLEQRGWRVLACVDVRCWVAQALLCLAVGDCSAPARLCLPCGWVMQVQRYLATVGVQASYFLP